MFRFRRYRVFVICAAVIVFLLFRVSRNSQWEEEASSLFQEYVGPNLRPKPAAGPSKPENLKPKPPGSHQDDAARPPPDKENPVHIPKLKTSLEGKGSFALPTPTPTKATAAGKAHGDSKEDAGPSQQTPKPVLDIPDRTSSGSDDVYGDKAAEGGVHAAKPPGAKEESSFYATSTIHWQKIPERWPVAEESFIFLPTGKPKPMRPVQHKFEPESDEARRTRESRLAKVKAEAARAWGGYKKYAWGHDELVPVSKKFRDPFCGWAATLVDSLDTLWIMGMKKEFDDAYKALKSIDFTTTPYRSQIPVFETIIRYLGGLVAAYDVTGGAKGNYPLLLEKATELAEILMGVFDTPNHMPILYYDWKPAFASQPERASSSASVAELGSMSMEFTRLAQLTGKHKYYDAVARITDAFEDWQNRGTALPGIFPQQVDASGCNRSAPALSSVASGSDAVKEQAAQGPLPAPEGYQPTGTQSQKAERASQEGKQDIEFKVTPGGRQNEPGTGEFNHMRKRDSGVHDYEDAPSIPPHVVPHPVNVGYPDDMPNPFAANGLNADWDCTPQGLTSGGYGMDQYSMGGSQDSTYEYFPKQYILLGGLVPKYKTMHIKVVDAVKKYLLYRPMIKDNRDILFSAKAYSRDGTDKDMSFDYEITHLTCFLGGMFALGGKVFTRDEDVQIGAKLADGCAWAYEVMPSGIMPEGSTILPCKSTKSCKWDEKLWHAKLDPSSGMRDEQMENYKIRIKEWKAQKAQILKDHEAKKKLAQEAKLAAEEDKRRRPASGSTSGVYEDGTAPGMSRKDGEPKQSPSGSEDSAMSITDKKARALEDQLDLNSDGSQSRYTMDYDADSLLQQPLMDPVIPPEPIKPLTHKEYIDNRIKKEYLPPGFLSLNDRRYLLRPEAIESVWYMYRITGDPIWQEKGWKMFTAVINATQTAVGHSAIDDVAWPKGPTLVDNMESFWLAETLKYFYLLFTTPDVISLDEWVFNTEAHPFRRPT